MIKVMLINAIDCSKPDADVSPPLGIGYLVSSLRHHFGKEVFSFKYVDRALEDELRTFKPDIVAITSVSQNYNIAKIYANQVKHYDKNIPVIIGGIHISMLPATITQDMDIGVVGEGEQTICDLFEVFLRSGKFDNIENIPGLVFRKNRKIHLTESRELIDTLDLIPHPARDIFPVKSKNMMGLITSRGCPYNCIFCSSTRFFRRVRFFSAKYVVNEIKTLIENYNVKQIGFEDDLFIANKPRLKNISQKIVEEEINKKVTFFCQCRANLLDDETVKLLKDMNVKIIQMGLESGCPTTLEFLKGRSVTVEDNKKAIDVIHKYGIEAFASFIIGSPYETKEDILETLKFIKKSGLDYFWVYLLTPLPGTPLWDFAKEKRFITDEENFNWDFLKFNFVENYDNAIILSQMLTRDELYELLLLFKEEFKRVKFRHRIKTVLKNPMTACDFLITKLRGCYMNKESKKVVI